MYSHNLKRHQLRICTIESTLQKRENRHVNPTSSHREPCISLQRSRRDALIFQRRNKNG